MTNRVPVICRAVALGICALIVAAPAWAQGAPAINNPMTPSPTAAAPNDGTVLPVSPMAPRKSGTQEARPRYPSNPAGYPSSAPRLRAQKVDPHDAAAQQQSGLSQAEAMSLIRSQGYT